jgi:hypothetical protein
MWRIFCWHRYRLPACAKSSGTRQVCDNDFFPWVVYFFDALHEVHVVRTTRKCALPLIMRA